METEIYDSHEKLAFRKILWSNLTMNESILVVDDEEAILKGINLNLGRKFDITLAHGSDEALKQLEEKGEFAVVVSDMRMPGMEGSGSPTPKPFAFYSPGTRISNSVVPRLCNPACFIRFSTNPAVRKSSDPPYRELLTSELAGKRNRRSNFPRGPSNPNSPKPRSRNPWPRIARNCP